MSKVRYPYQNAMALAESLVMMLQASCNRIEIAGSLRRKREQVGDIEIVYIPKIIQDQSQDLFRAVPRNVADDCLNGLVEGGVLARRENENGSWMWGEKNKFAVHVGTKIPVDFFSTNDPCWFNYLVCRTGGATNNQQICIAAQRKGWKWHPYGSGFTDEEGRLVRVYSEQDVYRQVGLPYLPPEKRQ